MPTAENPLCSEWFLPVGLLTLDAPSLSGLVAHEVAVATSTSLVLSGPRLARLLRVKDGGGKDE